MLHIGSITSDEIGPEGDEYIPTDFDSEGEKKVTMDGHLLGGREYRIKTFQLPGRANKLFMMATECAKELLYRDSYLLFNKNKSLYKLIATQQDKETLISAGLLPYSFRSRHIALVSARSMFRAFGPRIIVNGKRVRDDYWERKAIDQGFTEDDPIYMDRKEGLMAAAGDSMHQRILSGSSATNPHYQQNSIMYSGSNGVSSSPSANASSSTLSVRDISTGNSGVFIPGSSISGSFDFQEPTGLLTSIAPSSRTTATNTPIADKKGEFIHSNKGSSTPVEQSSEGSAAGAAPGSATETGKDLAKRSLTPKSSSNVLSGSTSSLTGIASTAPLASQPASETARDETTPSVGRPAKISKISSLGLFGNNAKKAVEVETIHMTAEFNKYLNSQRSMRIQMWKEFWTPKDQNQVKEDLLAGLPENIMTLPAGFNTHVPGALEVDLPPRILMPDPSFQAKQQQQQQQQLQQQQHQQYPESLPSNSSQYSTGRMGNSQANDFSTTNQYMNSPQSMIPNRQRLPNYTTVPQAHGISSTGKPSQQMLTYMQSQSPYQQSPSGPQMPSHHQNPDLISSIVPPSWRGQPAAWNNYSS